MGVVAGPASGGGGGGGSEPVSDVRKPTGEKSVGDRVSNYVMGLVVTTIGCEMLFSELVGPPWSWPRGMVVGWLVVSGLFGLIFGMAVDNLPPEA